MLNSKKECLDEFKKYINRDQLHGMDHVGFMDTFGWYCKKYYFDEKCCDDPKSERKNYFMNGDFYDLMESFQQHRDFILYCLDLSDGFEKKEGLIDRTIPRLEDTKEYKLFHNTEWFLERFLNPSDPWEAIYNSISIKMNFKERWGLLESRIYDVDLEAVVSWVRNKLNYKEFLKTQYWKLISQKKRIVSNFKCNRCRDKGVLNVHHTNYDILGLEYFNLKDLEVLCESCHRLEHSIDKI